MLRIIFKDLLKSEIDKAQYLLRQTTCLLEKILTSDEAMMLTDRLETKAKADTIYEHILKSASGYVFETEHENDNFQIGHLLNFHRNLTPVEDVTAHVRSCL
jgi:hypothetical protein